MDIKQSVVAEVRPSSIQTIQTWDVVSPTPKQTFKGSVTPGFLKRNGRSRRISIEIHQVPIPTATANSTEETNPVTLEKVFICLFKPTASEALVTQSSTLSTHVSGGWDMRHKFELSKLNTARYQSSTTTALLMIDVNGVTQERKIIFSTDAELNQFLEHIQEQKLREEERRKEKIRFATDGLDIEDWEEFSKKTLDILVEIVGCQDLSAADASGTSDPFVKVKLKEKTIHQTKVVKRSLNPIWDLSSKSFFILSINAKELFQNTNGLSFLVYDSDVVSDNDVLGAAIVPPKELYAGNEERKVYELHPYTVGNKCEGYNQGNIAIRTRHASDYDKEFMATFNSNDKRKKNPLSHLNSFEHRAKEGQGIIATITQKKKRVVKIGNQEVKEFKTRPFPIPSHAKQWMSADEIDKEAMKPSEKWKHAGNGTLGRIFVEVIGCYGLPNLDSMRFLGNKTDAFVKVVYEDVAVSTDTIDDCLSPRWLPWSQRAFVFYTMHPSSQVFLGVFDYDGGALNSHDLIGKVTMDVTHLRAGTEYTLDYDILTTTLIPGEKTGTMKIRVRKEVYDARAYMLAALEIPPTVHVNVSNEKEWYCVRSACQGRYNMTPYSLDTIYAYIEELYAYYSVVYYLKEGLIDLILWRSRQYSFSVPEGISMLERFTNERRIQLPLHSIIAFLSLTTLVERPWLIPSFIFALCGWLLLAVMSWRMHHPDPWKKCNTFREYFLMLLKGETLPPVSIKRNEKAEEARIYEKNWKEYIEKAEAKADISAKRAAKEAEEYAKEMEEITSVDGGTKTNNGKGLVAKLLEPYLHPIQVYLAQLCDALRFAKNVVMWEECYYSFWFTLIFFSLAIAFVFIPWVALVHWTFRVSVWTLFGPWMKLVDIYYVSKNVNDSEHETIMEENDKHKKLMNETRIKKEDVLKLADMKKYFFGQYHVKIFVLKMERFIQKPLGSSSAIPFIREKLSLEQLAIQENVKKEDCKRGQQLVGAMLPKVQEVPVHEAPTGKQIGEQHLLQKDEDAGEMSLTMFGIVAVSSISITWFGLPPLIHAVRSSFALFPSV